MQVVTETAVPLISIVGGETTPQFLFFIHEMDVLMRELAHHHAPHPQGAAL